MFNQESWEIAIVRERIQMGDDEFEVELPNPADGRLHGVELDLGNDQSSSGGDNLADIDEENMYGNDVPFDSIVEDVDDDE